MPKPLLAMVRSTYLRANTASQPKWAQNIGSFMILLDGEFSDVYTDDASGSESSGASGNDGT